ncbi:MAG: hypothetical protein LBL84_03700 [Candidatus Nomurabacteria bacterium]|jgi:hypothetical protein|nr:hypothetical protein [Candidatus Nomurabacteria bacterium]
MKGKDTKMTLAGRISPSQKGDLVAFYNLLIEEAASKEPQAPEKVAKAA